MSYGTLLRNDSELVVSLHLSVSMICSQRWASPGITMACSCRVDPEAASHIVVQLERIKASGRVSEDQK